MYSRQLHESRREGWNQSQHAAGVSEGIQLTAVEEVRKHNIEVEGCGVDGYVQRLGHALMMIMS